MKKKIIAYFICGILGCNAMLSPVAAAPAEELIVVEDEATQRNMLEEVEQVDAVEDEILDSDLGEAEEGVQEEELVEGNCIQEYYRNGGVKFGDINADGNINSVDLLAIQRHIAAVKSDSVGQTHPDWVLNGDSWTAADVTCDGNVDSADTLAIQRHMAGMIKILTIRYDDDSRVESTSYLYATNKSNYYLEFPDVVKAGYTFDGWYTSRTGGSKVLKNSRVAEYDHTIYSRWKAKEYKTTFHANGGYVQFGATSIVVPQTFGTKYSLKNWVYRPGYCFDGWYTQPTGGRKITSKSTVSIAGDRILYAHWKQPQEIDLSSPVKIEDSLTVDLGRGKTYKIKLKEDGVLKYQTDNLPIDSDNSSGFVPVIRIYNMDMECISEAWPSYTTKLSREVELKKGEYYVFIAAQIGLGALDETGKYVLDLEFIEDTSDIITTTMEYDIWLARSLILGINDQGSGIYPMFQKFQDPVYKQLGGYLIDDVPLVSMSAAWSIYLNSEYRNQFANEQKYIYEVILMDYLRYNVESGIEPIELENKSLQYSTKLYALLSEELEKNAGDYIDGEMTLEQAVRFYKNVEGIGEINKAISSVKDGIGDVNGLINAVSDYLALTQVKEEKIMLLKAARDGSLNSDHPHEDFIEAVDELIAIFKNLELNYVVGSALDNTWNELCNRAWDALGKANPVLVIIEKGAKGLDKLFDTTNKASANLKLVVLYTTDWYMKQGMMNAASAFMKNNSLENARQFNSCFKAYIEFQKYSNEYAQTWLKGFLKGGVLSKFINNVFFRDNIKTANDMIDLSKRQNTLREKLLDLIEKYEDIYAAMQDGNSNIPKAIFLNKSELSLYPTEKFQLQAAVTGTSAKVTWSSDRPSVAAVNSKGMVTAKKTGKAVITAKIKGATAKCEVIVRKRGAEAEKAYADFIKKNHRKGYYAIVNAGRNKAPVLMGVFQEMPLFDKYSKKTFAPEEGYSISLYVYEDGKVKCLSAQIPQSIAAGPWYLYKNKLVTYGRRGGIYTLNIRKDSFTRNYDVDGVTDDLQKNAKVIRLTRI